jgi:hypothetical protein
VAPFIPHVLPRLRNPALFITTQPLVSRLQQVPVAFGLNTLYYSPGVRYGLLGAAALGAIVIALLIIGAGPRELRGAGLAAALAGFVLVVPLLLALVGHDDFIARGLIPAWPPLAIVIAAACTTRGAKLPGAALVVVLVGSFIWAQLEIQSNAGYQRPDWRGVASALGSTSGTRAIVAYPGQFATGPLSIYLRGVPWSGPGEPAATIAREQRPVTIDELDVVGNDGETVSSVPRGMHLISARKVDGYVVDRFQLATPASTTAAEALAQAQSLLSPAPFGLTPETSVMIQPATA